MKHLEKSYLRNKKRGLIIYYGEYPFNGSWPNRINNISKIFELLNFNYKIVIPYPPQKEERFINLNDHVVHLQKTNQRRGSLYKEIVFYFKGILKSYQYIKSQKQLDFVLFAGGSFAICYPILKICKRNGIKVWIDVVDENSKKFETTKSLRDYLAIFNKDLFDKLLIPKFDKILVISDYLLEKYKKRVSSEILQKSTPSIIDIEEFDINTSRIIVHKSSELDQMINDSRLKLLYAGSVVRPNGIFFVLDCAAELITKLNYDFLIVIVVLMGDKERIFSYAKDIGIADNLLLLDKQDQLDMPAIYKQCDILFLPEQGNIIANAGFPGKTAELLASGIPVISTIFSDLDIYLKNGENALISPIGDKVSYTLNLKTLLNSEELRRIIGKKGRETAINYFDFRKSTWMYDNIR